MRSLSRRMLAAALATLVVAFVAFVLVFFGQSGPKLGGFMHRFQSLQLDEAVAAYMHGGAPEAGAYLERLSNKLGAVYYLTDERGVDLLTGEDRSSLLTPSRFAQPRQVGDRIVFVESSADSRYRLLILAPQPFRVVDFLPYYLLITVAVALFWWLLAIGIASPIRQLTATVDRFGHGDLQSRSDLKRPDEIGNLARAFNDMADRIQTLLTAERQLLQDISHELRSPLARMSVGIDLLETTPNRELAISRLRRDVDRLATLVGSLLDVTRSPSDPASRRRMLVDVGGIVQEAVESCRVQFDLQSCRVQVDGHTEGILSADPELIRRAVDNVLQNAIRHAPPNTSVDVSIAEHDAETIVTIRDYGPGVPDALLPRLTDPFFRVDAAREATKGGTGLGLAIAKRALELHHGTLVAQNATPGLRVVLTLPHASPA